MESRRTGLTKSDLIRRSLEAYLSPGADPRIVIKDLSKDLSIEPSLVLAENEEMSRRHEYYLEFISLLPESIREQMRNGGADPRSVSCLPL